MKIVFFDTDRITRDYLHDKKMCDCDVIYLENSIENTDAETYEKIKDAKAISVFVHTAAKMNAETLDKYPNLQLIATRSTGIDHIDLDYCRKRNIEVVHVPKYGEATVAEYTFGLLLNLSRKIIEARNDMKNASVHINDYLGFDLYDHTIGIIGTGAIGRHVAKLARGFGMHVLAYDLYPNEEFQRIYNIHYVTLDELYAQSDIITLHAPSTKDNHHLLNDAAFAKMKDGVIIINTARGDLIDTESLYKHIVTGKVAGAGLDVLENEDFLLHDDIIIKDQDIGLDFAMNTIANSKLLQHKRVIITPHIGFNSIDAVHRILNTTVKNIEAFFAGRTQNSVMGAKK